MSNKRANRGRGPATRANNQTPRRNDEAALAEVEVALAAAPDPPDVDGEELETVEMPDAEIGNATRLRNAWLQLKQREAKFRKLEEAVANQAKALDELGQRIAEDAREHSQREEQLAARESEVVRAEIALEEQRSVAKLGFIEELRPLTKAAAQRRDEILADVSKLEDDARVRAAEIIAVGQQELDAERARLAEERAELRRLQSDLREREAKAEDDIAFAKAKESMLDERVERRVESEVADVRERLADAQQLLTFERERLGLRDEELKTLRTELARYGDDPESAKRQIDELNQQLQDLRDELARRPPAEQVDELRHQAQTAADAQAEAAHWRQQHGQVDRQLRYQLVSVGELEVLRDERDALLSQRETLRQAIEQQRTDWEELQAKQSSQEPFPACSAYDRDDVLNRPADTRPLGTLAELVIEVRDRMATDSTIPFYYSQSDVRLFLAGMASSRLHLLQGISGTGKTSLPREFFHAIGGDAAAQIVEVQAGWRDRDDLFGYYNVFEKRFAESEFTKALYRALLPANADRPMVIVLDEINLAHPEQYFGSMLSILENAVTEPGTIDLLTSAVPGLPRLFEGSRLPLPRNVWFVGTANHDETTVAFADKTHDRAHVQELPAHPEPFRARRHGVADSISFRELETAFAAAARDHAAGVQKVRQFLNECLHPEFAQHGVGWGNRLERQVARFVPVVLDSGGGLTEAVDHLVATKLVRKLEDRFGVRPDDLDLLAHRLEELWRLDDETPTKSTARIRAEADRLRGGYRS